jgi:hypothetical protein
MMIPPAPIVALSGRFVQAKSTLSLILKMGLVVAEIEPRGILWLTQRKWRLLDLGNTSMKQISIRIEDEQKAVLLVELLSSLSFVSTLEVSDTNGESQGSAQEYPRPYISPQHRQMSTEETAFESMKVDLIARHGGEFVALFQQQVIDHDQDELALLARIDQSYPNEIVLIRQVLETPEPPLLFRAPRLVRGE